LYGAGLAAVMRIAGEDDRLLARLIADPLVESLLLVHDLHPVEIGTRVERALEAVMPRLGSHAGHAEFLGVDDQGVIHLRLERGGHGCNSSASAYTTAIEQAVAEATPEAAGVAIEVVEVPTELPLLQIGRRPAGTRGSR
ncbi:MAG TPA: NifU family protein, partial [Streptosporangiaceae bacterium]